MEAIQQYVMLRHQRRSPWYPRPSTRVVLGAGSVMLIRPESSGCGLTKALTPMTYAESAKSAPWSSMVHASFYKHPRRVGEHVPPRAPQKKMQQPSTSLHAGGTSQHCAASPRVPDQAASLHSGIHSSRCVNTERRCRMKSRILARLGPVPPTAVLAYRAGCWSDFCEWALHHWPVPTLWVVLSLIDVNQPSCPELE